MPAESAADRAGFFNEAEHAVAATWTLAAGTKAWPLSIILSRADELVPLGDVAVQLPQPLARVQVADLPIGAARGDILALADGSASWRVERIDREPDPVIAEIVLKARPA